MLTFNVQVYLSIQGAGKCLLEGRLHKLKSGRCRFPSPLVRSGRRPYVLTVQGGAANDETLAAEMPEPPRHPATFIR